jgi:23S rRNA pseudouridine2457 synthase
MAAVTESDWLEKAARIRRGGVAGWRILQARWGKGARFVTREWGDIRTAGEAGKANFTGTVGLPTARRKRRVWNPPRGWFRMSGPAGAQRAKWPEDGHRPVTSLRCGRRMLIAFHKPYGVLSQFTPDGSPNRTLAEFKFPPRVYPVGRLDADSEGLLLLSDEPAWNVRLLRPAHAHEREYWVEVERVPSAAALRDLAAGMLIQGQRTLPCNARRLEPQPLFAPRDPPVRFRKSVPTCWLALELIEGRNRQVRRMTAAVGHPTLRLVRVRIGGFWLGELPAGEWRMLESAERAAVARASAPGDAATERQNEGGPTRQA